MPNAAFIAGDWGTTHLRLHLCDQRGNVLERKTGPGIGAARGLASDAFSRLAESWDRDNGKLPAILCGMVGSTIGWRQVPYVPCPAPLTALTANSLRFEGDGRAVVIAPGLSCQNRLGAPDMMRGEETQILGAVCIDPRLVTGHWIICMPGTHTKWVALKEGAVVQFQTALTGELFDLLRKHSILVGADHGEDGADSGAFARAVAQSKAAPGADLVHLLFEVRSRQLSGELTGEGAAAYLSGLVIGKDVMGAKHLFEAKGDTQIVLVGSPGLNALYAKVLESHGLAAFCIDGEIASLAGLRMIHETAFGGGSVNAA